MAKDDDDGITVNVDDADVVIVDGVDSVIEPKIEEPKKPVKRVSPVADQQVVTQTSPEEALAQAQAYSKTQEEARRAAEATAESARLRAEDADRRAAQAQQNADQQRERADTSELAILDNGIAAAQQQVESFEGEYTRAAEAGEFGKMATIQTKLARAAAQLDRLENEKASFEASGRKPQTTEGRVEAQPVQQSTFEKYVSQFAPAAQTWMRQHPDCAVPQAGGNAVKNSKMMAGHYAALGRNIAEGTPDYFKVIEEHISDTPPIVVPAIDPNVASKAAEVVAAGEVAKPRQAQPSAPVSRDAPSANGPPPRNAREVRLTKDQQEMARVSFPHLPEAQAYGQYARNLIELEAEGKLGRLTH